MARLQRINHELKTSFRQLWLRPLLSVLPFAGVSAFALAVAFSTDSFIAKAGGVCFGRVFAIAECRIPLPQTKTARRLSPDSPTTLNSSFLLPVYIHNPLTPEVFYVSPYLHPNNDRARAAHPAMRYFPFLIRRLVLGRHAIGVSTNLRTALLSPVQEICLSAVTLVFAVAMRQKC